MLEFTDLEDEIGPMSSGERRAAEYGWEHGEDSVREDGLRRSTVRRTVMERARAGWSKFERDHGANEDERSCYIIAWVKGRKHALEY